MKVVFLSVPSKQAVEDGCLRDEFLKDVAFLHARYPEVTFICPVVQWYSIIEFLDDQDASWEKWKPHCEALIKASDELWVMLGTGWKTPAYSMSEYNTSSGVAGELQLAVKNRRKCSFVNVGDVN